MRRATRLDERINVAGFRPGIEVEQGSAGDAKIGYNGWIFASCLVLKEASVTSAMISRFNSPVIAHHHRPLVFSMTFDVLGA